MGSAGSAEPCRAWRFGFCIGSDSALVIREARRDHKPELAPWRNLALLTITAHCDHRARGARHPPV
jgi:hypothetical protein